jgi:hypothetical protein
MKLGLNITTQLGMHREAIEGCNRIGKIHLYVEFS